MKYRENYAIIYLEINGDELMKCNHWTLNCSIIMWRISYSKLEKTVIMTVHKKAPTKVSVSNFDSDSQQ